MSFLSTFEMFYKNKFLVFLICEGGNSTLHDFIYFIFVLSNESERTIAMYRDAREAFSQKL